MSTPSFQPGDRVRLSLDCPGRRSGRQRTRLGTVRIVSRILGVEIVYVRWDGRMSDEGFAPSHLAWVIK